MGKTILGITGLLFCISTLFPHMHVSSHKKIS